MNQFPGSILAIEYYLPEKILTNSSLQESFPDWKVDVTEKKTGVLERRVAAEGETAYDLALIAVKKLFSKHPSLEKKVDAINFCTQTPDYAMPSNSFLLQKDLGLEKAGMVLDFNLACSGYVFGVAMASSFIKSGMAKNILLVTGDTYSKLLEENDRATRLLFGDGASASWIASSDQGDFRPLISSFRDFQFATDGKGWDKFIVKSGAQRQPHSQWEEAGYNDRINMSGIHVVNFVKHLVTKEIAGFLIKNQLSSADIDQYLVHQASSMALECIVRKLRIPEEKLFSNIEKIGNTVSSSIPIAIKDYFDQHELNSGSLLLICGFGVGFSVGTFLAEK